jgi:hypothetical protein
MASVWKLFACFVLTVGAAASAASEIGYIEDFALADDRTIPLAQLIPGTEDYYYYHCLHYQNIEQFQQVDKLLADWIKRHNYTPRVREIQNRQALLTYPRDPQQSLEHIRQQLNLQFNHQRETVGQKPDLPTALDPAAISRQRLTQHALARFQNLEGFEDPALDWLTGTDLNPDRRRHLLGRLRRPDYANLPQLVVDDLNHPNSGGFGSLPIHGLLLLGQLDECAKRQPDLLNQTNFVNAYLVKLQPSADVDWQREPDEHVAYLDRLWAFVQRLGPVHNSLKAHVLYHRLELDRARGIYDKDRFMAYVQLPRPLPYVERKFLEREDSRRHPANLNADFRSWTLLPPVGNDEPLVRSYLHHFFLDQTTYEPLLPYINDQYLRRQFAETKIVNGLGEGEQWSSLLSPSEFQALKDRVDMDFAFTNPPRFSAEDSVGLDVYVKNVGTLIVKVFEINTANFYRENLREVNTDINLDGLVPNWENTYQYPEPPLRRVRRRFDFPELNRPGVYVVDFIGSGRSSRAVIRKGGLRHLVRTTTAGQAFTVLDEQNRKLKEATIWLAGREYSANDRGEILVPYSNAPGRQQIVLSHGGFSSLGEFEHESENYALRAGIYVDRESLLQRNTSSVVIRPQLVLNGIPVTLSLLEDVRLTITSHDRDGVSTTKELADFELFEDRESVYEFQVPQRLRSIEFRILAKVQNLSQNKKIDLSVSESFSLNEIDGTDKIEDLHLVLIDGQYAVDVLGRTGESRSDRPVRLTLKHRDFTQPVQVTLKSDPEGRVLLGPLPEIVTLTAQGPEDTAHTWNLWQPGNTLSGQLHGGVGERLVLPYPALPGQAMPDQPTREEFSLLELRGESFVADHFDSLSLDGGLLQIQGLDRGDYDLWLKRTDQQIRIRIADGRQDGDYVLGTHRQLEVRNDRPLQIASVEAGEQTVTVRVQHASPHTRVHLLATHYWPAFAVFEHLARVRDAESAWAAPKKLDALYVEGRQIGDEYQYIIDRRYATKFPGNMLQRPSLLLNPWPIRTTETGTQEAKAGEEFLPESESAASRSERAAGPARPAVAGGDFANLDFLAEPSVTLWNLEVDEHGVVSVPREQLGAHQHVHVVAIDPRWTVYRTVSLPQPEVGTNDLRLTRGLDPDKHFAQKKQITVVSGDQPFEMADITSSRFEVYDSLAKVYSLYTTLSSDAKLAEFSFVARWPQLTDEEKRAKYSEFACHELNLFLYHKDPQFFRAVVAPLLENKKEKQFMDRWLLGNDLTAYLQPWDFQRLNIAERILLAQRIDADRGPTTRHVRDLFALLPPDIERFHFLFETAVQGSALEMDDALGFEAAKGQAERDRAGVNGLSLEQLRRGRPAAAAGVELAMPAAPAPAMEPPADGQPARQSARAAEDRRSELARRRDLADKNRAAAEEYFADESELRKSVRQLYQKLDKTQEWVENHYYRLAIEQQTADLISVNALWRDYAEHDPAGSSPFRSVHLAEASRSFPEMMFALAVLDLPFTAEKHETQFQDTAMKLKAASPLVVFHEEIQPVDPAAEETPILVSQNFFRHGDRYQFENNERLDKFVTDEFLIHVVYGCQVVVTNPTSSMQKLDVLLQVPVGAIPVLNSRFTRSVHTQLQPFSTQTLEYYFYFPAPGQFPHYPVQVAKNERLLAHAEPFTFQVVAEPTRVDTQSWDYLSQFGTHDQVIEYLEQHNLHRTNVDKIAFRMQDRAFFDRVIPLLSRRHAYNHTLWSYGIRHDVPEAIQQFLLHADNFVNQCGDYLRSPLLTIDPVARKAYEHMEYKPLVNARAHQLGARRQIVNDRFHQQYHQLLKILSYRRQLDQDDLMSVVYYLLLQDRVEEAIAHFERVDPQQLATRLQHDYFTAYLAFSQQQPERAEAIVARYTEYPVDRWRKAFAEIGAQLAELGGQDTKIVDDTSRDQVQTGLAASEASFDFRVEARQIDVSYQNLKQIAVNYYLMDIELLFSRNPFVQQFSGQFSHIRPNLTQTVDLPADARQHRFALPETLHNRNVLVEIRGAGQTRSQAYYANSLAVQVIENYGQVRVADNGTSQALPKVYVKVYARMTDGRTRFYKDGYTDLRGRFDYASLSTNELDFVDRFALLVMSEENGAVVREAAPPKR